MSEPKVEIIPTDFDIAAAAALTNVTPMQHAIADHIEMWHERELAPGAYLPNQLKPLHDEMHTDRTWDHTH